MASMAGDYGFGTAHHAWLVNAKILSGQDKDLDMGVIAQGEF